MDVNVSKVRMNQRMKVDSSSMSKCTVQKFESGRPKRDKVVQNGPKILNIKSGRSKSMKVDDIIKND